ncbi:MAG: Carboxypeptidase 1 [Promethearchaeota archaeon]|nr:MAG: Carboxypeptidase 1 [Candidatus Lokiarchaeota archaeon]
MTQIKDLKKRFSNIKKIDFINNLLRWDQQVYMPEGANKGRAELIAFMNSLKHKKLVSEKTGRLIKKAEQVSNLNLIETAILREAKRAYSKAIKIPIDLVKKIAKSVTIGHKIWEHAREKNNFSLFQPILQQIIELKKQYAELIDLGSSPYDSLIDDYEPGATSAWIQSLFDELKLQLISILKKILKSNNGPDDAILHRYYPSEKQWQFSIELIEKLNFDFNIGRQDKSVHPFTMPLSETDIRITTRIREYYLPACIFGTIHECGHALYNMGFMEEIHSTNLAEVTSLGIHESQSRLWETIIGKSQEFWNYFYPLLQSYFPKNLQKFPQEKFYRALNKVEPSLIRVEADEITYPLHIIIRFEIEKMIFEDHVQVGELPSIWNEKMNDLLGINPPDDALGILQDVHWSGGAFGYFPSYTLGNLYAAQIFSYAKEQIPNLHDEISQGEFSHLLKYLRDHIHQYGAIYYPHDLIKRINGDALNIKYFITYLKEKYYRIFKI